MLLNRIAQGNFAFYADDIQLQAAAASAGAGIAVLPDFVAEDRAELAPVPATDPVLVREIWLVTHAEQRHQERILRVTEALRAALKGRGA